MPKKKPKTHFAVYNGKNVGVVGLSFSDGSSLFLCKVFKTKREAKESGYGDDIRRVKIVEVKGKKR